jgi:hypothetical protein
MADDPSIIIKKVKTPRNKRKRNKVKIGKDNVIEL